MLKESTEGVSPTDVHEILRNERRRRAIKCLLDADGPVTVRALSEEIAEMETGESPPPCEARKSVYVTLHQNHLSKLEEAGIVRCDSNEVEVGDGIEEVKEYVTEEEDDSSRLVEICAGLSLLGILAAVVAGFGVSAALANLASVLAVLFFAAILVVCLYMASYGNTTQRRV